MTIRITVALAIVIGLVGPLLGQTSEAPLPQQQLMPGTVAAPVDGPSPYLVDGVPPGAERFWAKGDYLLGWMRSMRLPPLVTTSPPGTPQTSAGVLGAPGTTILFGSSAVDDSLRSGGRFGVGYWFDCLDRLGAEASFFFLTGQSQHFNAASDGTNILGRPFFDVTNNNSPVAVLIAYPGLSSGKISVVADSHAFSGANVDLAERVVTSDHFRMTALVGYRFMYYNEILRINSSTNPEGVFVVPGTQINVQDSFKATNQFNGVEGGFRFEFLRGDWSLEVLTKLAYGRVGREVDIAGGTQTLVPGESPVISAAGLLALPSNIGPFHSSEWAGAADLGVTLGWNVTEHLRLRVGYLFLYWARVARAADQIDQGINPNLIPPIVLPLAGSDRPSMFIQTTEFWIQSITLGAEVRY